MKENFAMEGHVEARKAPLPDDLRSSLVNPDHFPAIASFVQNAPVSVF